MFTRNPRETVNLEKYSANREDYKNLILHAYEMNIRGLFATPESCRKAVFGKDEIKPVRMNNLISDLSVDRIIYNLTITAYKTKKGRAGFEDEFPNLTEMNLVIPVGKRPSALLALNPVYWGQMDSLKRK